MKSVLLVVLSLLFSLAAIEGALRVVGDSYPEFNALHPVYGWKPRPGVEGRHAFEGEGRMRINAAGFRDADHETAKPDGVFRIAVLGDSFTEAREVDLAETYWKRMETGVQACIGDGRRVEVLNFAVNGYGTAQQYLVLRDEALTYAPDVVLLAVFIGNDIWNNSRALDGHSDRPFFTLNGDDLVLDRANLETAGFAARRAWADVKHFFYNRLRTLQIARKAYVRLRYGGGEAAMATPDQLNAGLEPGVYRPPSDPAWDEAWTVTERLIAAVAAAARAAGADPWAAFLPTPIQVFPDPVVRAAFAKRLGVADLGYPERRLADAAATADLPAVDLTAPLRAYAAERGVNLHGSGRFAGGHWNAEGHAAAARVLTDRLCAAYGG
jgi:hypothetical protein